MDDYDILGHINEETIALAKEKGLTVRLGPSDCYDNKPCTGSLSTFVGGERGRASDLADENLRASLEGECIEDAVRNYANDKGIDKEDMLWWTVHQYQHRNILLDTTIFLDTYRFETGIAGFIFESKKAIRKEFGVKRISSKLKSQIEQRIKSKLTSLCEWANGEVYTVSIWQGDELKDSCGGVYDSNGGLNAMAVSLINYYHPEPA